MIITVTFLLSAVAVFVSGELGQAGYPIWDAAGITHGGGGGGGGGGAVVHHGGVKKGGGGGGHGGFFHGGKKGVVYPPGKKGGFFHGGKGGGGVVVSGGGHGGFFHGGKKGVVYPPGKKGGFFHGGKGGGGVVSGGGHGGFFHGGKKGVVYPPGKKGGVVYPHVKFPGGGKYPHGNVQKVGGHGYFPDKAPGLKGYGKGIYYKQVANVGPLALSCPYGWQYYHGSCYYFSRDRLSWWKAYAKCSFMGGYLAVVNYAHENSYLKLMCKKMKFHDGAWFGLNDVLFPKTHTWYWGFGKKGCKWFDWFGKGPKYRKGDYNCVCFKEDYHYQWALSSCSSKMYYICELNPKKPCICGY